MSLTLYFFGSLFIILFVFGFLIYNKFVKLGQEVSEAWFSIDILLKKRYDLIPNLVSVVKGYAEYEQSTLEKIVKLRQQSMNQKAADSKYKTEAELQQVLNNFFILSEKYPDLKANQQFQNLYKDLVSIEDSLARARRYYNGTVRKFNTLIQTFPDLIIAKILGLKSKKYFSDQASNQTTN